MLSDENLSTINQIYKHKDLLAIYDKSTTKLTANNVNTILSSLIDLHNSDTDLRSSLLDLIDQLRQALEQSDENLSAAIYYLSGIIGNLIGLSKDIYALSANYAGYVINKLYLTTNLNNTILYNGDSAKLISGILSSYYTNLAIHANESDHTISSDYAITADIAKQANNSYKADHALTANLALSAKLVEHPLMIMNAESHEILLYDGSSNVLISSILHSTSSLWSDWAFSAIYASQDIEGNEINTKILHNFNEDNKDYPLLFSEATYDKIEEQTKYNVNYHNQIVVNPYLGAIKANLFYGTALSSTYAIADKDKILLNTRVVQNCTSNNYNYPILLSFISKKDNESDYTGCDGEKNEILYTELMRINPNLNLIKSANTDIFEAGSDLTYVSGGITYNAENDLNLTLHVTQKGLYSVNFEGLATRALADQDGYEIGKKVWLSGHNEQLPILRPLIFPLTIDKNKKLLLRDLLGFCSGLYIDPQYGNLSSNASISAMTNILAGYNLTSLSSTYVNKDLFVSGSSVIEKDLHLSGNAFIEKNTTIGGITRLSGNTQIKGSTTLDNVLQVASGCYFCDYLSVVGATSLHNTLTVTKSTNLNDDLTVQGITRLSGNTQIDGSTTLNNVLEVVSTGHFQDILSVEGYTVLKGNVDISGHVDILKNQKIFGELYINDHTSIKNGILYTTNNISTNGELNVAKATKLHNTLTVSKDVYFNQKLTVDGICELSTIYAEGIISTNTDMYCQKMYGVATSAQWADLAEKYETDIEYPIGTLICFGGLKEITIATNEVNGVISNLPAYLMNSKCNGQPIALVGRVPVLVKGLVNKFDYITISDLPGIGISTGKNKPNNLIGRALKEKRDNKISLLECIIQLSL